MTVDKNILAAFAPTGVLRASINAGNPVLAGKDQTSGEPFGVSVDLARALAEQLGVGIEFTVFETAGKSVDFVTAEKADIGFFAIDPLRGQGISFTDAYVLIEGAYVVRKDSPITANEQVDAPGIQVSVGGGSAYDLFLTRELKQATIVRSPTSQVVVKAFIEQKLDVAAGVKQQLEADTAGMTDVRMLPGRFMEIRQAMGMPKGRGPEAAAYLSRFVEEKKASGFVAEALKRHGIQGASVAPASSAA